MHDPSTVTLASLTLAGCARYPGASGHLIRTAYTASCLAGLMGLNFDDVERIRLVTPVHDLGKIGIPDAVLLKPGKLTSDERHVMEHHSAIGADLLGGSEHPLIQLASKVARHHHEHFDGTGYPDGLVGDAIPFEARIVAVADVFDALTEPRIYREQMSDDDALSVILAGSGTQFDPIPAQTLIDGIETIRRSRAAAQILLSDNDDARAVAKFYGLDE